MADVQVEKGYVRVANHLATAIALAPWTSASQPRMVMALVRATYGMRRRDAAIGTAGWRALTGLTDRHISETRNVLEREGVFVKVREFDAAEQTPATWRLQKDYSRWGRFAVAEGAVRSAEDVATGATDPSRVRTPDEPERGRYGPGHQVRSGSPDLPPTGSPDHPPSGSGGEASEGAPALDEVPPKDRKDRKDKTTADPRAHAHEVESFMTEAVVLANKGMTEALGSAFNPLVAAGGDREVVREWLDQGVSPDTIRRVVYDRARTYEPKSRRQIFTMAYFTDAVLDEHRRVKAAASEAPDGAGTAESRSGRRDRDRRGRGTPQTFEYPEPDGRFDPARAVS